MCWSGSGYCYGHRAHIGSLVLNAVVINRRVNAPLSYGVVSVTEWGIFGFSVLCFLKKIYNKKMTVFVRNTIFGAHEMRVC